MMRTSSLWKSPAAGAGTILLSLWMAPHGCQEADDARPSSTASIESSVAPDSEKIEASLSAAQQYMQSNEIGKAEAILRTLIDRAPNEPRGHELLGQALTSRALELERTGQPGAALLLRKQAYECYQRVVELQPDEAGILHSAGLMAMAAGETDDPLEHFQRAASLEPNNPQFALFASQMLIQQKRYEEAKAALKQALHAEPDEPYAHASLAMIALEEKNFSEALERITRARSIMPDDAGFRAQQARIHRQMNEPRMSLELLIGLPESDRAQEVVAFEIAAAYERMNEPRLAASAWALCYNVNPRAAAAWRAASEAGRLFLEARAIDQAARWADAAATLAPDAPDVAALRDAIEAQQRGQGASTLPESAPSSRP